MVEANYEFEHISGRRGHTGHPAPPGVLDAAQRRRRPALRQPLHVAVHQRLAEPLDTPGSLQMAIPEVPVRVASLVRPRSPTRPHRRDRRVRHVRRQRRARRQRLRDRGAHPGRRLVMAYMPTVRTITVDMSSSPGPRRARGTTRARAPSPRSRARRSRTPGRAAFTPPGTNSDGDGDWVLVLEATGAPPDTQPAVGAHGTRGLRDRVVADHGLVVAFERQRRRRGLRFPGRDLVRRRWRRRTTDTGLTPLTSYSYTVAAFAGQGS